MRQVLAVQPAAEGQQKSKWADLPLTIDASDHPVVLPDDAGLPPTLLSPTIINVKVSKMMYDPGSSINLLSLRAFEKMQIPRNQLTPSAGFWGGSGVEMEPLGKVALEGNMPERQ